MTGRERVLAAFRGGTPDTVPFAPNLYHWFYSRRARGALPEELEGCAHPFDALRRLGADILARWDTQWVTHALHAGVEHSDEFLGQSSLAEPVVTAFNTYPPHRNIKHSRYATPYGVLTQTWAYSEDAGADFLSEYLWKDWGQYEAVRYLLESTSYQFDAAAFQSWVNRVADDGVMMVHITQSPLKTFHWLAGPANASLFAIDHPEEMKALALIHEEKALDLIRSAVDHPAAEVFLSLDNLDSVFYPPYFYRDYCDSFFRQAAEIIHSRGKFFVVHACGRNRVTLPLVGSSGVDSLEGLTPPPMGDVELSEARRIAGRTDFVVNGGIDPPRQEITEDAEARIHDYTRRLFASMGDTRRFIFASSCSTSPRMSWENLIHFRNAARQYGRASA